MRLTLAVGKRPGTDARCADGEPTNRFWGAGNRRGCPNPEPRLKIILLPSPLVKNTLWLRSSFCSEPKYFRPTIAYNERIAWYRLVI